MKAKLSVLGLYQWNNSIFADMALPEEVDADVLTWKILEDCAELEVIYSDPDYMKASIYNWSSAMLPGWKKMQEALTAEYNPIWNKDGTVRETYKYGEERESYNIGSQTVTTNIGARNQETTHQVTGFNSGTMENSTKDTTNTQPATDTQNSGIRNDISNRSAHTDTVERIEQGNIGVTESSAMVRHEMELRADFNIYSIIENDFKKHYCLMLY